jgi:NAD(P)-dependent dehydrogenase (short-subunit alcohol dehydrogenase family)
MTMEHALRGQSVLVTGGGGGLGRAAATALARDGAAVMIMGRSEDTLLRAATLIVAEAGSDVRVGHFVGDALEASQVAEAVAAAEAMAERLGMAVAVVGGGAGMKPLLMSEADEFATVLNRNVVSAFLVIKHATPAMVRGGGGSIVCVSSTAAHLPWPLLASYAAGKAGVEALVKTAALELGPLGVRVNAVRPGLTESGGNPRMFEPGTVERFIAEKPLGRTGRPDDIAAGIRYLAGPESSWVTGQSLAIDGGHELTKAPELMDVARQMYGDEAVDAALRGEIPA